MSPIAPGWRYFSSTAFPPRAAVDQVLAGAPKASGVGRPTGIVTMASRSRPRLVDSVAQQISAIGRLPRLGMVDRVTDGPGASPSNSGWRLRAVHDAFAVGPDLAEAVAKDRGVGDPILLIDDFTDSGWTLTVVAHLLRQSGAGPVLPLVLATQ
jgi:ATP-dependent DNA helicase RecQ